MPNFREWNARRIFTVPSVVNFDSTVNVSSVNKEKGLVVKDALSHVRSLLVTENLLLHSHSQDVTCNVVAIFSNTERFGCLFVNDVGRL